MIVESITVEQYRGFGSRTNFEFHKQFAVVVGNNGSGKTSVLWTLRVTLSHIISSLRRAERLRPIKFVASDVANNMPYLRAEASVLLSTDGLTRAKCDCQKNVGAAPGAKDKRGVRATGSDAADKYAITFNGVTDNQQQSVPEPLAVYYSAHRSISQDRAPTKDRAVAGIRAAHAEALDDRALRLREAALLWRNEAALESDGVPARANRAIEQALPMFLGDFRNMRVEGDDPPRLIVEKRNTVLDLTQLSDGERGLLAVLLDLTRRLALANPCLEHPARDGCAIVLIDELDLHMHPRWQRDIVSLLSTMFPNCQFIATTHSPQIIGEVQPESLVLLRQEEDRIVPQPCGQAYGLDTNHVLEYIMGTSPRTIEATNAIAMVESALDSDDLETARSHLDALRRLLRGNDAKVIELEATINNLEALGDATD